MTGYEAEVNGVRLFVCSSPTRFSPRGLDRGTALMLAHADIRPGMKLLDLGCGTGVVGAYAAKCGAQVWMSDVSPEAVETAAQTMAENHVSAEKIIVSDAFDAIDEAGFDCILCNPPYHTDFAVARRMIEKGFNRLKIGGAMTLVVKRELWYRKKLESIFGGVRVLRADGYALLTAERRQASYARTAKR